MSFIMNDFNNSSYDASTSMPLIGIPILDNFLPGFSVISRLFSTYLHIDISSYLSLVFLLTTVAATVRLRLSTLVDWFGSYLMSRVEIRWDDEMFNYLMYWISQQNFSHQSTRIVAGTKTRSRIVWSDSDSDSDNDQDENDSLDDSFDDYWARRVRLDKLKPIRVTPAEGRHWFRYKSRWIEFTRSRGDKKRITWGLPSEKLYLRCFGRDPSILKELLRETQRMYVDRDGNRTIIYCGQRNTGDSDHDWVRCMARPPRPLSTVVLDELQKQAFLNDVKEYLHPRTHRWYSNRGIPYRRGYMFYGPPGTGKSSLCFAAAGSLHLKIYLISLNSKTLTEDGLAGLFQSLPRRCIILLEDVDAAGITNKRGENSPSDSSSQPSEPKAAAKSDEDKSDNNNNKTTGVSLSALLNIIDGVASSEGRILVMTTNHIEKLDPALLRPGRVDMSIAFGYSDTVSIKDLFMAIYAPLEGDLPKSRMMKQPTNGSVISSEKGQQILATPPRSRSHSPRASSSPTASSRSQAPASDISPKADIAALAEQFTGRIPSGEFTPAEIQGYLLRHKNNPEVAIEGAGAWVQNIREEKGKKAAVS